MNYHFCDSSSSWDMQPGGKISKFPAFLPSESVRGFFFTLVGPPRSTDYGLGIIDYNARKICTWYIIFWRFGCSVHDILALIRHCTGWCSHFTGHLGDDCFVHSLLCAEYLCCRYRASCIPRDLMATQLQISVHNNNCKVKCR